MELELPEATIDLACFREADALFHQPATHRMAAGLRLLVDFLEESEMAVERIDRVFLDAVVDGLDARISAQLDEILHHAEFQELEGAWRGLAHLVQEVGSSDNARVEILDCSCEEMGEDLLDSPGLAQSGIYRQVYTEEYDTPGGEPYTALLGNWYFDSSPSSLAVLHGMSQVAAAAHCPFLSAVNAAFFGKASMEEIPRIEDLERYMERAEFMKWRSFRDSEDSRYTGLVLPRFLLRLPWDTRSDRTSPFHYREDVSKGRSDYLWGNAVFPFAVNMVRSFASNGWCVQIRGPESGGRVDNLPIHYYDAGRGLESMLPVEMLIPETREYEFARQGFIPLSVYKNRDYACFFSASSAQKPREYQNAAATANARVNARLPYLFLTSRIAHYLKVIQRENIGAAKDAAVLQQELDSWLKGLVTEMKNPGPELVADHPLSYGEVRVEPYVDNPGFYKVALTIVPHFQVEGVDVSLSLTGRMPAAKS